MDNVQCPHCGTRRTCWERDDALLRFVIRCLDCGAQFAPPPRVQIARTVDDVQRAVAGKRWHSGE